MTITLNNYEEYFLLLADNELSAAEETQVKTFAAQHPHLQEELTLLMDCRLDAADMPVFPKEKLLRITAWDVENPEPLHTQLLSLLDNELTAAQTATLHQQIAASPALQTEWNILQQTKLPVESVAHPDKNSLYRQHKIRPIVWMRWAAAAAVFAIAWLFWPRDTNSILPAGSLAALPEFQNSVSTVDSLNVAGKKSVSNTNSMQPDTVTSLPLTQQPQTDVVKLQPYIQPEIVARKENKTVIKKEIKVIKENPVVPDQETLVVNEPDIPTLGNHNFLTVTLSGPDDVTLQPAQFSTKTLTPASAITPNTLAINNLATDEEEFIHIAGARIDKQKMRGLFRGVTRSVVRTFSKSKMKPAETAYTSYN